MSEFPDPLSLSALGSTIQGRGRNDFTQFGEDGLIEAAFEKFGIANEWCFEVGAADGVFYSNTLRLRNAGWYAVLIEAGKEQFNKLREHANERVQVVHETIGPDSLDRILRGIATPRQLDLGVIDIDGQDWWAWDGMNDFRPRLMLVEFLPVEGSPIPELGGEGQAGLDPIIQLGIAKQYTPLVATHVNVLFVANEIL